MRKIEHPYENLSGGQWLRGNLHAHTTRSDGACSPQQVIEDYARRGYDFLMLSDHDLLTAAKDYEALNCRGLTMIAGNEITANGPHILHVDADRLIAPNASRQQVFNDINAAGGFAIVNHPNWEETFDHCPLEQMRQWTGYAGMEIYNATIGRLDGSPYATNKWDMLLAQGRRIWGFANDDSHLEGEDVAQGWNVAYAAGRGVKDVVSALRSGRFYASTGVVINHIGARGNRIRVETQNARRIVALRQVGQRFAVADASTMEVEVPDGASYVRFECWGDGEQFAWTNPFFVT